MENIFTNWELEKLEFNKILQKINVYSLSDKGKDKILNLLPQTDIEEIRLMHKLFGELRDYITYVERLSINRIFNFYESIKKVEKKSILHAVALYELSYSINIYFNLKKKFDKEKYPYLSKCFIIEKLVDNFYQEILKYINEDGYIESKISRTLEEIRDKIGSIESRIKKATNEFYREVKSLNYTENDIISVREGFNCVAIKSNYKNRVDGIVLDSSGTGQTVFVVPKKALELHNELVIAKQEENEEIRRILKEYSEKVALNAPELITIDKELVDFEILYAKTKYGIDNSYITPKIIPEKRVKIINGRHPFLGETAIPLNLEMGSDYKILVITGPNTGGKTVVLKTLGLFALMVQTGIGIPTDIDSEICVFDRIFVDMGDEQSIEQSLSTFSSHIKKIIYILNYSTKNSLILLDELGAGTDPVEGSALAIGILRYIKKLTSICIITTHYSALKHFASGESSIQNGSMEFDNVNFKPTYKLLVGIPGSSRALEISEKLGLLKEILDEARRNINEEYFNTEKLIEKLEQERKRLDEYNEDIIKKERLLLEKDDRIYKKRLEIEEKEKELNKLLKMKEHEFLSESRKEFEQLVKEIKTSNASKEKILEGKSFFKKIEENLEQIKEEPITYDVNFNNGDKVFIKSKGVEGFIAGKTNNPNEYFVQVGIIKLNIKTNDLHYIEEKEDFSNYAQVVTYVPDSKNLSLDLRGFRYEEAEKKLDKFVEQALAGHLKTIKIIHGKGTGAIRQCIQNYFDHSPFIASYDYETDMEGKKNFGITVAQIR